ncbi:MAG TPA: transporter substrate-binding domain-containing protein [Casimicrobiaceae bacterium]|nr:transporter substrate-binding domain-containing protein [Casimicrobiaceae bacterium]
MSSRRDFITKASGAVAGAGLIVAQAGPASAQDSTGAAGKSKLDEVMARGKLIVGVTSEAPPFGFIDDKGQLVGFDIDMAKMIAKEMLGDENKIELYKQGFAARWPNVENGTTDFGIMVTTVYPDRALRVAFTRPYVDSGIVLVVKKDSPIKTVADLNKESNTVAHLTAPVQEERGKRLYPKAKFLTFDSISAQFNAVKLGRATAAQLDTPVALWYIKDNPDIRMLEQWLTDVTGNAIFLRQNDFKWWLYLDTVVAEFTGGSRFSEYKALYKKWLGVEPRSTRITQSGR